MSDPNTESTLPNQHLESSTDRQQPTTTNVSDILFGSEHIVFLVIGCMVLFFMVCLPIDFYKYHKRRKDKKDRQGSCTVYSRTGPGPFLVVASQDNREDTQTSETRPRTRHPFFKFIGLITLLKKKPVPSASANVAGRSAAASACSGEVNDRTVDDGVTPSTSTRSMSMSTMPRNSVGPSCGSVSPADNPAEHSAYGNTATATTTNVTMIQSEIIRKLKGNAKITGQVNSGMIE